MKEVGGCQQIHFPTSRPRCRRPELLWEENRTVMAGGIADRTAPRSGSFLLLACRHDAGSAPPGRTAGPHRRSPIRCKRHAQELLPRFQIVDPAYPKAPFHKSSARRAAYDHGKARSHTLLPLPRVTPKPCTFGALTSLRPQMREKVVGFRPSLVLCTSRLIPKEYQRNTTQSRRVSSYSMDFHPPPSHSS